MERFKVIFVDSVGEIAEYVHIGNFWGLVTELEANGIEEVLSIIKLEGDN